MIAPLISKLGFTFDGLQHGGQAQKRRRSHTDFGSGWQGLGEQKLLPAGFPGRLVTKKVIKSMGMAKIHPFASAAMGQMNAAGWTYNSRYGINRDLARLDLFRHNITPSTVTRLKKIAMGERVKSSNLISKVIEPILSLVTKQAHERMLMAKVWSKSTGMSPIVVEGWHKSSYIKETITHEGWHQAYSFDPTHKSVKALIDLHSKVPFKERYPHKYPHYKEQFELLPSIENDELVAFGIEKQKNALSALESLGIETYRTATKRLATRMHNIRMAGVVNDSMRSGVGGYVAGLATRSKRLLAGASRIMSRAL